MFSLERYSLALFLFILQKLFLVSVLVGKVFLGAVPIHLAESVLGGCSRQKKVFLGGCSRRKGVFC